MRVRVLLCLLVLGLGTTAVAQNYDAVVFGGATAVVFFDTASSKVVTFIATQRQEQSRGGLYGPDGLVYTSDWTANGIAVLDPKTWTWVTGRSVADPTNLVMGAPYQPALNYDNLGGFGLWCIDGNSPPASFNPPANSRNSFVVNYGVTPPAFRLDGIITNPSGTNVPMSDAYPNPYGSGFVCVGFPPSDMSVMHFPLAPQMGNTLAVTTLAILPQGAQYDATFCEDGNFYVVGTNTMMIVDIRTQKVSTVAIQGLPTGYCGVWSAPWEQPGMKGWIANDIDDTFYSLDLLADPMVVTSLVTLPFPAPPPHSAWSFNTARSTEENQLSSWKIDLKGKRNFHLFFGSAAANQTAILVPNLSGLARNPAMLSGLEIYLVVDAATFLGLQGILPYVPVAVLDSSGQADIPWNGFGLELNIRSYWQALALKGGKFIDASNIINVGL